MFENRPKVRKALKITLICLLVLVLLLGILAGAGWIYLNSKLDKVSRGDGIDYTQPIEDTSILGKDLEIDPKYLDVTRNGGKIEPPDGEIYSEKDVDNILLIGTDERDEEFERSRADSMMLLSINNRTNEMKLVSFERAIGVSIPDVGDDWLTHVFAYGGPELLLQTIRSYFKVDVSRYVRVNFYVFETAITDIGGVDIDLTEAEAEWMNDIAQEDKFEEGINRFDGPTALQYARIRQLDSDWHRIERQRKVIQAAVDQATTLSLDKIDLLADKLLPMVDTNLTNTEMASLILKVPTLAGTEIEQMTIPAEGTYGSDTLDNGRVIVSVDFAQNAEILKAFLYDLPMPTVQPADDEDASSDSSSDSDSSSYYNSAA